MSNFESQVVAPFEDGSQTTEGLRRTLCSVAQSANFLAKRSVGQNRISAYRIKLDAVANNRIFTILMSLNCTTRVYDLIFVETAYLAAPEEVLFSSEHPKMH